MLLQPFRGFGSEATLGRQCGADAGVRFPRVFGLPQARFARFCQLHDKQPLVYDNVPGVDDSSAVEVESGRTSWSRE